MVRVTGKGLAMERSSGLVKAAALREKFLLLGEMMGALGFLHTHGHTALMQLNDRQDEIGQGKEKCVLLEHPEWELLYREADP